MFCPNCGKPDQQPDGFCRACGEFLSPPQGRKTLAIGGATPHENLTSIKVISAIGALSSLSVAVWMYLTNFSFPIVLYLAASLLICNAIWHISNLVVGSKLTKRMTRATQDPAEPVPSLTGRERSELLFLQDKGEPIPISVTENTTRNLTESRNPSSQPEN